jgi:hypothetical protein
LLNIKNKGLEPIIEIVRVMFDEAVAHRTEAFYIKKYGRLDLGTGTLLNNTDGGEGFVGYWTEKRRKRQARHGRRLAKIRWSDPAEKVELAELSAARWAQPEYRAEIQPKMKKSAKRRANDPKWQRAHSRRIKKLWKDPLARERMLKGVKPWSAERRVAQSMLASEQNKLRERLPNGRFA